MQGGAFRDVVEACGPGSGRIAFILPPLVLILEHAENEKGAALTEADVLAVRDSAGAIAMDIQDAITLSERRGQDLDPGDVWRQWLHYRAGGELTYPNSLK
jgi:hypothetical protein